MYPDVVDLSEFYESELGGLARRLIRAPLRNLWGSVAGLSVMGLGFATPHLRAFTSEAKNVFAFMPAQQGVTWWPREGPNVTALVEETSLPLEDSSVDRILLAHALENTDHIGGLLEEAWRVLAGNGRMIVIVPHRGGFWSMFSKTPFGFGFAFSMSHVRRLLTHNRFQVEQCKRALFVPPFLHRLLGPSADWLERNGKYFLPAGVLLIEVSKQVYARPSRDRVPAKPILPLPDLVSPVAPSPTAGRQT